MGDSFEWESRSDDTNFKIHLIGKLKIKNN